VAGAAAFFVSAVFPALAGDGLTLVRIDRSTRLIETAKLFPLRVAGMVVGLSLAAAGILLGRSTPSGRIARLLRDASAFGGQLRGSLRDAFALDAPGRIAALALIGLIALAARAPFMFLPLGYDESIMASPWQHSDT
jgi:hypothetical protein